MKELVTKIMEHAFLAFDADVKDSAVKKILALVKESKSKVVGETVVETDNLTEVFNAGSKFSAGPFKFVGLPMNRELEVMKLKRDGDFKNDPEVIKAVRTKFYTGKYGSADSLETVIRTGKLDIYESKKIQGNYAKVEFIFIGRFLTITTDEHSSNNTTKKYYELSNYKDSAK